MNLLDSHTKCSSREVLSSQSVVQSWYSWTWESIGNFFRWSRKAGGNFALGEGLSLAWNALWSKAPTNFWGWPMLKGLLESCMIVKWWWYWSKYTSGNNWESRWSWTSSRVGEALESSRNLSAAVENGIATYRASFCTTATDTTYSFLQLVSSQLWKAVQHSARAKVWWKSSDPCVGSH